jgi:hypothetical protein
MVQNSKVYEPEYSSKVAGQRCLKLLGNMLRVVFEHATSPSTQNDRIVTLSCRNREDLIDPCLQSPAKFIPTLWVLLQYCTCVGSRRRQERARERGFQELAVAVAKNNDRDA